MDWNRVEGNWKQVAGKVKEKWGKLTDDDLTTINGRRDQLEGKIQERYGLAKDQVKRTLTTGMASSPGSQPLKLRFRPAFCRRLLLGPKGSSSAVRTKRIVLEIRISHRIVISRLGRRTHRYSARLQFLRRSTTSPPTNLSSLPSRRHLARTSSERAPGGRLCHRARSMGGSCDLARMSA